MNWLDKAISATSPTWGLKRQQARAILAAYEANKPGRLRKMQTEMRGPDSVMMEAGAGLRGQARHLDENHDLVTGILDTLVARTVGPAGIMVEPMVRGKDGKLHNKFNRELLDGFNEWYEKPDVTGEISGAQCEQLMARTWFRDGEGFTQFVVGPKPGLIHPTKTKLLLELLEPDIIPWDYESETDNVYQGVQKNAWGAPTKYWAYKEHPGELRSYNTLKHELKAVPAANMVHLKLTKRIRQTRGVSALHSVLTRIQDLKDYEESERIAARVAAAMCGYIKRGSPDSFIPPEQSGDRSFKIAPGLIFDNLQPGEEIGTVQSNRPSVLLEPFRNAMLKMIAAGTRVGYSSTSKDYNGSYSAQRQELVEQWDHYTTLQGAFTAAWKRPIFQQYIKVAIASGRHVVPRDVDASTLYRAHFQGPAMPWIDPNKESQANERNVQAGFTSRSSIIRSRNQNPVEVTEQIERERDDAAERGLIFSSDTQAMQPPAEVEPEEIDQDENEQTKDNDKELDDA
jgi:lambda family phage portal protein